MNMNKEQFLQSLKIKLKLLQESEVLDILEEYGSYIDMKVSEGSTQEDAVKDFGDVDKLAADILEAYKINVDYKEKSKLDSGNILQDISYLVQKIIDYAVQFFSQVFKDYTVNGLVSAIVMAVIALIIIMILRLPFTIIEGILSLILRIILPNFFANFLMFFISLAMNVAFTVIALLILIGMIKSGLDKKTLQESMADLKNTNWEMYFYTKNGVKHYTPGDKHSEAQQYATASSAPVNKPQLPIIHASVTSEEAPQEREHIFPSVDDEEKKTEEDDKPRKGSMILVFLSYLVKFIVYVTMIPLSALLCLLFVVTALLVYLTAVGVPLLGPVFIGLSAIFFMDCFMHFLLYLINHKKFRMVVILFILAVSFFSVGSIRTFYEYTEFTYLPLHTASKEFAQQKSSEFILNETFTLDTNGIPTQIIADEAMEDKLRIVISSHDNSVIFRQQTASSVEITSSHSSWRSISNFVRFFVDNAKDNKIYYYDGNGISPQITLYTSAKTIGSMTYHGDIYTFQPTVR